MTTLHSHVSYYRAASPWASESIETHRAHVVAVIDADTLTLDVDRPGVATERIESVPRCDPATPTAGCWSEIPA